MLGRVFMKDFSIGFNQGQSNLEFTHADCRDEALNEEDEGTEESGSDVEEASSDDSTADNTPEDGFDWNKFFFWVFIFLLLIGCVIGGIFVKTQILDKKDVEPVTKDRKWWDEKKNQQ